jgi:hypothetical protein
MKQAYAFLSRVKVFDADHTLSLTNVMLMVLIFKVATSPIDWTQLCALFMALSAYQVKKLIKYKETSRDNNRVDTQAALDAHKAATVDELAAINKRVIDMAGTVNAIKSFQR